MAYFRWKGEVERTGLVVNYGPTISVKLRKQDGTIVVLNAPDQNNGYAIDEDVAGDVLDERCLRALRADPRFEEYTP
jgi:hypothetical protein